MQSATLLKILVFHNCFSKFLDILHFKNTISLTKPKRYLLFWYLWIQNYQMTCKYLASKNIFSNKINPMKYPAQTHMWVRTWNLLFVYFSGVSYWTMKSILNVKRKSNLIKTISTTMVIIPACYYHSTYGIQSESTAYIC